VSAVDYYIRYDNNNRIDSAIKNISPAIKNIAPALKGQVLLNAAKGLLDHHNI
jgi:hypothetical protein